MPLGIALWVSCLKFVLEGVGNGLFFNGFGSLLLIFFFSFFLVCEFWYHGFCFGDLIATVGWQGDEIELIWVSGLNV